jgi:methylmalonyl-CoA/ethylmalonyl-CoA epimerase
MALLEPGRLHRLALAVDDAGTADAWFRRVLGARSLEGREADRGQRSARGGGEADLEGTDTALFRLGGFPFILLSKGKPGGPVARFLERYGPAVHSLAWEVDDMWTVQNLIIESGIRIGAVNIPGRHFFMHPRDTQGVLMEWTDDTFGPNGPELATGVGGAAGGRGAAGGAGGVGVVDLAWVTAAVADATETAGFLTELAAATTVDGNACGPKDRETTVDVKVGDLVMRLVTPLAPDSPYAGVLDRGPRLCSYALRVRDLGAALQALEAAGVPTVWREDGLAATDPAATVGVPTEWTQ